ncbi:hypothetical protein L3Q82_022995 [Scortum barcoo]|uniref:Uncharacterized protein n=1 Tax=Scortum barcoo TaxID=214431 RepID=A0ACB8WXQ1_9TELE|nr:hypothetical protein L3Q82_022995 [Scortum barcoo]
MDKVFPQPPVKGRFSDSLDPLQFAYRPNRSTEDAIALTLPHCPLPPGPEGHIYGQHHTLTLNTGAPQGCVVSHLLYSWFMHACVATHSSNTIIKSADRGPPPRPHQQDYVWRVSSIRFLGVHISEDLTWTPHIDFIHKVSSQTAALLPLQAAQRLNMDSRMLCSFYRCTIERILT